MGSDGDKPSGGIQAKRIQADNVVRGTQVVGFDAEQAARMTALARDIQAGTITADDIIASNVVEGLQVIGRTGQPPTQDQMRTEIAALRQQLDAAIAKGAIKDPGDAQDAKEAVARAEEEVAKPKPVGDRIAKNLEKTSTILTKVSGAVDKLGDVGNSLVKLAPIASALAAVAMHMFG
jgi:hypothetical protein